MQRPQWAAGELFVVQPTFTVLSMPLSTAVDLLRTPQVLTVSAVSQRSWIDRMTFMASAATGTWCHMAVSSHMVYRSLTGTNENLPTTTAVSGLLVAAAISLAYPSLSTSGALALVGTLIAETISEIICTGGVLVWLTGMDASVRFRSVHDPAAPVHAVALAVPARTLTASADERGVFACAPGRVYLLRVSPLPVLVAAWRTAPVSVVTHDGRSVLGWDGTELTESALPDVSRLVGWSRPSHHSYPAQFRAVVWALVCGVAACRPGDACPLHLLPDELLDNILEQVAHDWQC
jgi:hypothetical protein